MWSTECFLVSIFVQVLGSTRCLVLFCCCCSSLLCLRWWGSPDFVFHGMCVIFFFYQKPFIGYHFTWKHEWCFCQWWGELLEDQRKQRTRKMMSLGTTSSCQDSQNQLFVKNVKKLVTTKGHVKERQWQIRTFQKGVIR